jgi:hypothetical protein
MLKPKTRLYGSPAVMLQVEIQTINGRNPRRLVTNTRRNL